MMVMEREAQADYGKPATEQAWIFQINPDVFDITELIAGDEAEWPLRQHAKDVREGDQVIIWLSGKKAGIYALATVLTDPSPVENTLEQQVRWGGHRSGKVPPATVMIQYNRVFSDTPFLKTSLVNHALLKDLRVIRLPRATNFAVSADQWASVRAMIG